MRVDFYIANTYSGPGTGSPVTLSNLVANIYDVDNDQAVEFDGAATFSVASNTHLAITTVSTGNVRFTAGSGDTTDSSPTLSAFTVGRAKVTFAPSSFVTYRLFGPANDRHAFDVDFSPGVAWSDYTNSVTEIVTSAQPSQPVSPSPAVADPNMQPVPPATPPPPVRTTDGVLPELSSAETLVSENGIPMAVELIVENDSELVLRSEDFELRLRGACTVGCTIIESANGRETIHLDRNGAARLSGFGFLPGSLVHVWIFSEPRYLGALLVAPDGTYEGSFPLADIEVGGHTLQANGFSFDNVPRSANLGIVVVDNTGSTPGPGSLPAAGSNASTALLGLALLALGTLIVGARRRTAS